jgi:hypothetical protein
MVVGIVDHNIYWGSIIVGFAMGCWCVDRSTHGWGINVGVVVGRRSWTVMHGGWLKPSSYHVEPNGIVLHVM